MSKLIKILFSSLSIYIFVLFFGAWLTLIYESENSNANIVSYYDALWWTLNATSIGDSNVFPITIKGRIIGAFLIVIGYGLFTINVATISSFLNHIVNSKVLKYTKEEIKNIKKSIKNDN